ncbi:MAG: alpha-glucosidase [Lachnospiraceae bacterium]|nr:alpha-glucosidase [Lachnospiraceae bacterium]
MIRRYIYGNPFITEAVVKCIEKENNALPYFVTEKKINDNGEEYLKFSLNMKRNDMIFGLGENVGGINKRGKEFISYCTDESGHNEDKRSLYAAHNFILYKGENNFGLFVDTPGKVVWDLGFTDSNLLTISLSDVNANIYLIENCSAANPCKDENRFGNDNLESSSEYEKIVSEFRELIGKSYVPPFWALGYIQSRWGYNEPKDFKYILEEYRKNNIPIDAFCMDIDYMEEYEDFTVNKKFFPDFEGFVSEMKNEGVHLIPIIDAGVKIKEGYKTYEEGVESEYFCKEENGKNFVVGVWPGKTHMPDFLNRKASEWFGQSYKFLIDKGIDGFWNDMNEPATFYSEQGLKKAWEYVLSFKDKELDIYNVFNLRGVFNSVANNPEDHKLFYHDLTETLKDMRKEIAEGKATGYDLEDIKRCENFLEKTENGFRVRHDKVHNVFGFNMTKAAMQEFEKLSSEKILLFSRASYIGMHRYGGIWTGDNCSLWGHLLMNVKMMPSLNMCGFLYSGADTGGFGGHCQKELMERWIAFSIFTPLFRNHAAWDTREQELFRFGDIEEFAGIIRLRYRLLPYIYEEYMKAVENNKCLFKPLFFEYDSDERVYEIEDQLLYGDSLMITPVVCENARGRMVYLPEEMLFVKFKGDVVVENKVMEKGDHYIKVEVDEVPLFIRKGKELKLCESAKCTKELDMNNLTTIAFK